jgi:hypothetical protein
MVSGQLFKEDANILWDVCDGALVTRRWVASNDWSKSCSPDGRWYIDSSSSGTAFLIPFVMPLA